MKLPVIARKRHDYLYNCRLFRMTAFDVTGATDQEFFT
jgi:hypothetical protein